VLKRIVLIALVAAPAALAAPEPGGVTIAASPPVVTFGDSTELSGGVSPPTSVTVSVTGQTCSGAPLQLRSGPPFTVKSSPQGAWSATTTPLVRTTYRAGARGTESLPLRIDVRPRMTLTRVAKHRFHVHVAAAISFEGRIALFQRRTSFGWKTVKSVAVYSSDSASDATTSDRTFNSGISPRQTVRVLLPPGQVGDCYSAGISNTVRS